jgi:hypothetical protein
MAKQLVAEGRVPDIDLEIRKWLERDREAEGKKKRWGCGIGLCGLGMGGSIFVIAALPPLGVALLVLFLVGLIASIAVVVKEGKFDFENRKIEIARKILAVMAQDVPRREKCTLTIDETPLPRVDQRQKGYKRIDIHRGTWLDIKGTLHDGNEFRIQIERTEQRRFKNKPGKGWRSKGVLVEEEVIIKLDLSPEHYPNTQQIRDFTGAAAPCGVRVTRVNLDASSSPPKLVARAEARGALPGPDPVLELMTVVYENLEPARAAQTA